LRRQLLLVAGALMSALAFVATFLVVVPLPWTGGYFNLGDAVVILSGLLFGPVVGGISGAIGPTIADYMAGYSVFIPATLVAKSLEGAISGLLARKLASLDNVSARRLSMVVTGIYGLTGASIALYVLLTQQSPEMWIIFGTWAFIFLAFSFLILGALSKGEYTRSVAGVLAGAIGATAMVSVYFLYEQYLMGVPAIFEVIPNCLQAMAGSSIAGTIYGFRGIRDRVESINQ